MSLDFRNKRFFKKKFLNLGKKFLKKNFKVENPFLFKKNFERKSGSRKEKDRFSTPQNYLKNFWYFLKFVLIINRKKKFLKNKTNLTI